MKISVIIPAYNSAEFIGATLDSVLRQTRLPDEILVMDDGSTDDTVSLLNSYSPRITVFQQKNQGVAQSRNALSKLATGDLVSFLDHDDLWHPRHLEVKARLFEKFPDVCAFFSGHLDFNSPGKFEWNSDGNELDSKVEVIDPLSFLVRYNRATGPFGSMSFCSVPKRVLAEMGPEPFCVSGVDDSYFCTVLPLVGQVVYAPAPLVAYRVMRAGQSANRLKSIGLWVKVFELLADRYRQTNDLKLQKAFCLAFAFKRRRYGKLLMGSGRVPEARGQFCQALRNSDGVVSKLKSLALWFLTWLPARLQPAWPSGDREAGDKMMNSKSSKGAVAK